MRRATIRTDRRLPPKLPDPEIEPRSRWLPSLVWVIPLIAALIGVALVVKSVTESGPTITISFVSAEGLEPGKTKLKYKDVDVGTVKTITLSQDLSHVLVRGATDQGRRRFAVKDTRFWVVRPRVGASGVSGSDHAAVGRVHRRGRRQARRTPRRTSSAWKRRRRSPATRRATSSRCTATRSARSTSARRSSTGACRSARWSASRSTRTAPA